MVAYICRQVPPLPSALHHSGGITQVMLFSKPQAQGSRHHYSHPHGPRTRERHQFLGLLVFTHTHTHTQTL